MENQMMTESIRVRFENATAAEASQYSRELAQHLTAAVPDAATEIRPERENAQDFGTMLVLVLGAPAVVAAVNAIVAWRASRPKPVIVVETSKGIARIYDAAPEQVQSLLKEALVHLTP